MGSGNNSPIFTQDPKYKFGSTAGDGFNKIRIKKSMQLEPLDLKTPVAKTYGLAKAKNKQGMFT